MKFSYKFSGLLIFFIVAGYILAVACFIANVIRIVNLVAENAISTIAVVQVSLPILISLVFAVLITSIVADSCYRFDKEALTVKFGFIKNHYSYSKIKQIVLFSAVGKLTVFFEDETFMNVVISKKNYDLFVETLKSYRDIPYRIEDGETGK